MERMMSFGVVGDKVEEDDDGGRSGWWGRGGDVIDVDCR